MRDWLVAETRHAQVYTGAKSLHREQERLRPGTKQPFYCNYWCGEDSRCICRIEGSRSLETDAMFFLEAGSGRRLGVHVEFKHAGEPLLPGQAEGYPLRAGCWARRCQRARTVVPRDDWLTVIFCGDADTQEPAVALFERRIGHGEAREMIPGYPAISGRRHADSAPSQLPATSDSRSVIPAPPNRVRAGGGAAPHVLKG